MAENTRLLRKVIQIRGIDSPNVRLALAEIQAGREPSHRTLLPGVLSYQEYLDRLKTWDPIRIEIGIHARFPKDTHNLLWPPDWLNRAEEVDDEIRAELIKLKRRRPARALGFDSGQGTANSSACIGDERGVIYQESRKTKDTSVISDWVPELGRRFGIPPEQWIFDAGGGGQQHVDYLRKKGYTARTVGFGERVKEPETRRERAATDDRLEKRQIYKNRRAQMYGEASQLFDPHFHPQGYGLPRNCTELRRQLGMTPKLYDGEGRIWLPPKEKKKGSNEKSMTEILGCSPDEADSFVLMVHGIIYPAQTLTLGRSFLFGSQK